MVDGGFDEEAELNIDWDHLLGGISDDPNLNLRIADGFSTSPNSGFSLSIDDIEQYLMGDDESNHPGENDQNIVANDIFADVLIDSPTGYGSGQSKDSSASPESAGEVEVVTDEEEKEKDKPHESGAVVTETKAGSVVSVVDDDDENNDPLSKKRKRQMRNRDAAVRSRERKKMYVRDLEMKSKYYESECKRLGIMLQCCVAENQALRLSLHNSKAFDGSMAKQESAVLLLESLLLGSLLWLLGIIYLLILASLSTPEAGLLENVDSAEWERLAAPTRAENKFRRQPVFNLFMLGRRCKASRSRIKLFSLRLSDIDMFM